ncbi:MAG: hypothetical protein MJ123_07170 [Lachnospiraceae bacterium]|nr:hypothetical protein [Lachnospiraceae bacterium]
MNIELTIDDKSEILRYLGFRNNELTKKIEDDIEDCIRITNEVMDVRTVWRLFDISYNDEGTLVGDMGVLLPGKSLVKHLDGTKKAVMFGVTIGSAFDEAVNKLMISDPGKGVVLNSCGITLVEKAADALQFEMDESLKGYKTGVRFSPGYGDLPLDCQDFFISSIDATRRAGIRLNRNMLMNPVKSVTAIAGVYKA